MPGAHFADAPEEELQEQEPVEYPTGGMATIYFGDQEVEGTTSGEDTDELTRKTQEMCWRLSRRKRQRQERAEEERRLDEEAQAQAELDRQAARETMEAERNTHRRCGTTGATP